MPNLRDIQRVLIVEDDSSLRAAIVRVLDKAGFQVLEAGTAEEGLRQLGESPDLIIADIRLPDGSGHTVFEASLERSPEPLKIGISGAASADEAFRLSQLGVRAFLPKPFSLSELKEAIARVQSEAPELDPLVRASVGRVPLREVQSRVREVMIDQALAMTGGSRSGAARLLDVTRQAVQQVVRKANRPAGSADPEASPADDDARPGPDEKT